MDSTITSPFPAPPQPTGLAAPTAPAAPSSSLAALAGDRCASCAAPLASDQRYCLECGERNGEPRVPAMSGRPALAPIVGAVASVSASRSPRGAGGSTALIAGVGTLLLALGVGVLIGHSAGNSQQAKSAAPQIITVGGGAVAGTPTASTSTPADTAAASGAAATTSGKDKKSGSGGKKAGAASTPVSGTVVKKTPGKVVKIGSKGSGKGYKNGKFTGDFFGN